MCDEACLDGWGCMCINVHRSRQAVCEVRHAWVGVDLTLGLTVRWDLWESRGAAGAGVPGLT